MGKQTATFKTRRSGGIAIPLENHSSCLWQYKFDAISGSSLEHSLYLAVRGLICWRQRHGKRRHTEFLEPFFQPGGSEQNEHPALLRFDCERVGHIAR